MSTHPCDIPLARLVEGWLRARSFARALPAPVPDSGGWRVDTGSAEELRRHVFAEPGPGLMALADEIDQPRVLLKCCASPEAMRALLPPRWVVQPPAWLMTAAHALPARDAPSGYAVELSHDGAVTVARILTRAGEVAASGWAAEVDGFHIYDRIRTEPGHRRRGLGTVLMGALGSARKSGTSCQVLVATAEGMALYATLGWRVRSPYTTAALPG